MILQVNNFNVNFYIPVCTFLLEENEMMQIFGSIIHYIYKYIKHKTVNIYICVFDSPVTMRVASTLFINNLYFAR